MPARTSDKRTGHGGNGDAPAGGGGAKDARADDAQTKAADGARADDAQTKAAEGARADDAQTKAAAGARADDAQTKAAAGARADDAQTDAARARADTPTVPPLVRSPPAPLSGGPLAFWRFARGHNMLLPGYVPLIARWLWLKLRWRGRFQTDGLCFICPGVKFEIGPNAVVRMGRWSWLGHGCKVRAHEGVISIGAKSVLGQECTFSCYKQISIGRECIIADRVMMIDFDHGMVEVERSIRNQGIYMRDVSVGHNVWIGYGACVLRGVTVGDNSVVGTNAVVTAEVPPNAVVGGVPAKLIRMREKPETFVWED